MAAEYRTATARRSPPIKSHRRPRSPPQMTRDIGPRAPQKKRPRTVTFLPTMRPFRAGTLGLGRSTSLINSADCNFASGCQRSNKTACPIRRLTRWNDAARINTNPKQVSRLSMRAASALKLYVPKPTKNTVAGAHTIIVRTMKGH